MSGMSLMPSFSSTDFRTGETDDSSGRQDTGRIVDSADSVNSMMSSNASPDFGGFKGGIHRPPGLGYAVPSPIGKPGHSYTSSASTAQNLTLTPTSSLDGGEIYRGQSSPFHGDGPSLSSTDMPPGFSSMGSYDEEDGEHDGLLGLQALRDRANSAPGPTGPYSSSPLGALAAFDDVRIMKPRTVSRDNGRSQSAASRPPLSGNSGSSPHATDTKSYFQSSGNRSRDHSPTPPGVISRPGMPHIEPPPYDPARRRSIDFENGRDYNQPSHSDRNQPAIDQLAYRFGQLGHQTHIGNPHTFGHDHPGFNGHQRASSMPGPMRAEPAQGNYYEEMALTVSRRGSDYGLGMTSNVYHGPDSVFSDNRYNPHPSQYSQEQVVRSQINNQRRSSLQSVPGSASGYYVQSHNVHRRESLDFVPGHNRHPDGLPVLASNEEIKMFMNADDRGSYRSGDRVEPPVHGHVHYSGSHHSRHPSDMGASTLSSSPASLSSGCGTRGMPHHEMYAGNSRGRHRVTYSDDDLSHPLVGEHIDMHGDDRGYPPSEIMDQPHVQGARVRNFSGEHHLPHYGGASAAHVLPMAGSLPIPKIMYNIKFKRTQRAFVLGPRLNRDLKVGTYVKVEADRGEDLGIVIGKVPSEKVIPNKPNHRAGPNEVGPVHAPGGVADLKRITRLATHEEVALLNMKREEEEELLKICRAKVRQRGLNMNIVDAEYQFDRHKLTFFFEAEGRVDFRELVRDLFSMYKTRIWMQQLDKTTTATCPTAPEEDPALVIDYGTPILAPESEYSEFTEGALGATITD